LRRRVLSEAGCRVGHSTPAGLSSAVSLLTKSQYPRERRGSADRTVMTWPMPSASASARASSLACLIRCLSRSPSNRSLDLIPGGPALHSSRHSPPWRHAGSKQTVYTHVRTEISSTQYSTRRRCMPLAACRVHAGLALQTKRRARLKSDPGTVRH
jgi:hypothetical protein